MKYEVFFTREGYAVVDAATPQEALAAANKLKDSDVSWNESFRTESIQEEETGKSVYASGSFWL